LIPEERAICARGCIQRQIVPDGTRPVLRPAELYILGGDVAARIPPPRAIGLGVDGVGH
jgi:hypothetical protein